MIHQYKLNGYNIVLDVYSGSVHAVDELAYDAIALVDAGHPRAEAADLLAKKYADHPEVTAEDINDCFDDIEELKAEGKLFAEDIYADHAFDFKNRSTVVKALCLHVAHTCNLNCEYCFAAQGKFHGQSGLMSFETGNCSYNQKQSANAPVSEEAFSVVKAALDDLLKDAPILAGMKFVHWFDREIPQEDDPLYAMNLGPNLPDEEVEDEAEPETPVNELTKRDQADRVPASVFSGQAAPDLDNVSYYILLLSGVGGRIMIRKYVQGNYADLRRNLAQWYDDLALTNWSGIGNIKPAKLFARWLKLLTYQKDNDADSTKKNKKLWERLTKELAGITPAVIQAILSGGCLPDAVAAKALAYIRSELLSNDDSDTRSTLPNSLACQWLKVWLLRKNRIHHQEGTILEAYNLHLRNAAYHCGGLMAVYAAIQRTAMPDVNTGIVERYYASAIQMPALVIGQLSSRSNHHLEKIENGWLADKYREKLQEISVALGTSIPATLNLEQQSYFALGYYQMGAKLNQERTRNVAAAREKTGAAEE
mgnify:CR=1 FL=1